MLNGYRDYKAGKPEAREFLYARYKTDPTWNGTWEAQWREIMEAQAGKVTEEDMGKSSADMIVEYQTKLELLIKAGAKQKQIAEFERAQREHYMKWEKEKERRRFDEGLAELLDTKELLTPDEEQIKPKARKRKEKERKTGNR
jgi:hypothetical protein